MPQFSGSSYIAYQSITGDSFRLNITIRFRPFTNNGLILFNSYSVSETSDFVAMAMVDGYLEYRYDLGSGVSVLRSASPLELDVWHVVVALRAGREGTLSVNGEGEVSGSSPGPFLGLNLGGNLWLGGTDSSVNASSLVGVDSGLVGCVEYLFIGSKRVELVSAALVGSGITRCAESPCESNLCQNGATCEVVGSSFTCLCPPGFTGVYCMLEVDPCAPSPCAAGATCLPTTGLEGFLCQCPEGRAGVICDIGEW